MKDYIYIISNDQGFIKVGVSKHPEKRVKQLQTGNENKLTLIFTEEFECARNHLLHIEKSIHSNLKRIATKKIGEWFFVEDSKLESVKNTITYYRIRYEDDTSAFVKNYR